MAAPFAAGSAPGSPKQTGQTCVFGGAPNAVELPNTPEFIVVHLAIARLGAVMCTVHMPYRGAEIEAILAHSGAKLFFNAAYPFAELEAADPLAADR